MTRVLIAEDSPTQAAELRMILESEGFEVERAADGQDALDRLGREPAFDVVVSDIMMPRLTGYELCRAVKHDASLRRLPVILVTTLSDPMDIIKGLECGADNFVRKPYEGDYLVERIRTLLANRQSRNADKLKVGIDILFLNRQFTVTSEKEQILDLLIATFEDVVRTNRDLQASQSELARARLQLEEYARRLETRAAETEERYRLLLQHASDAVFISDEKGAILEVNHQAELLFGRTSADIVGQNMWDFFAASEQERIRTCHEALVEEGHVTLVEIEVRQPGEPRYVDAAAATVEIGGRHLHMAILRDVTDQRKMRAQLLIADRMASVGTLAAGVAHEINNPLTSIVANMELADEELQRLGQEIGSDVPLQGLREMVSDARLASERVRTIVRDIKRFSRSEHETVDSVDLRRLLESSTRMAWNEIRHRARLVEEYGDVPPVAANESRLSQVFLNLIVNAAQAIPEGRVTDNEIRIRTRAGEYDTVHTEISDTGSGIPPEVKHRLFTPFFTTKPPGVGTGLGLSICQRIVTAHGGSITVESEPGQGTTFRVTLPAAREGRIETRAAPDEPARAARRGRVLVVDDEPKLAAVVERTLSREHDVEILHSAVAALEHLRDGAEYDLILCDLMMPEMTGMELYEHLHQTAPDCAGRMVFLTGGAFTPGARAFLDKVENHRLEKPFNPRDLRAFVNQRIR